jgi:hypothetical protein
VTGANTISCWPCELFSPRQGDCPLLTRAESADGDVDDAEIGAAPEVMRLHISECVRVGESGKVGTILRRPAYKTINPTNSCPTTPTPSVRAFALSAYVATNPFVASYSAPYDAVAYAERALVRARLLSRYACSLLSCTPADTSLVLVFALCLVS